MTLNSSGSLFGSRCIIAGLIPADLYGRWVSSRLEMIRGRNRIRVFLPALNMQCLFRWVRRRDWT